jgi:predicted phosphodiesterase
MDAPGYGRVVAIHANAQDDEMPLRPNAPVEQMRDFFAGLDGRLILYGHTHQPVDRIVDGVRIVNDGSAGLPLDGDPRPAYALLDFEGGECAVTVRRVEYDREAVIAELERVDHPARAWVIRRLREAS